MHDDGTPDSAAPQHGSGVDAATEAAEPAPVSDRSLRDAAAKMGEDGYAREASALAEEKMPSAQSVAGPWSSGALRAAAAAFDSEPSGIGADASTTALQGEADSRPPPSSYEPVPSADVHSVQTEEPVIQDTPSEHRLAAAKVSVPDDDEAPGDEDDEFDYPQEETAPIAADKLLAQAGERATAPPPEGMVVPSLDSAPPPSVGPLSTRATAAPTPLSARTQAASVPSFRPSPGSLLAGTPVAPPVPAPPPSASRVAADLRSSGRLRASSMPRYEPPPPSARMLPAEPASSSTRSPLASSSKLRIGPPPADLTPPHADPSPPALSDVLGEEEPSDEITTQIEAKITSAALPSLPEADEADQRDEVAEAAAEETVDTSVEEGESEPAGPALEVSELEDADSLSDLPEDALEMLAGAATVMTLERGEEVSGFALALILEGEVDVASMLLDVAAFRMKAKRALRSSGHTKHDMPIRLIGTKSSARLALWTDDVVERALAPCPWVEEELRQSADEVLAQVGIMLGPLGDRLDAHLRSSVMSRLSMKHLSQGELVVEQGKSLPGIIVVGVGQLEKSDGSVGPGEFLFPECVLGAGAAPMTVRAGEGGALVFAADRMTAQELLVTCPPLLEIFAGM
jgi:hypothetical protein